MGSLNVWDTVHSLSTAELSPDRINLCVSVTVDHGNLIKYVFVIFNAVYSGRQWRYGRVRSLIMRAAEMFDF